MASVRGLKKDIQFLTEIVITDAIYVAEMLQGTEEEKTANEVIANAVDMYNTLMDRTNHPDEKDNPKLVKQHYKKISVDLLSQTDDMLSILNKLLDIE